MRILGASVKFTRQLPGVRKGPGVYAVREAEAPLVEDESLGECVQRAFAGAKARVCVDLNLPPNSEIGDIHASH